MKKSSRIMKQIILMGFLIPGAIGLAAGGKPTTTNTPVVVDFRCEMGELCSDSIQSVGGSYIDGEEGVLAFLDGNSGNLAVYLNDVVLKRRVIVPARSVYFSFENQAVSPAPCGEECRRDFEDTVDPAAINSGIIDHATGELIPGGMYGMAIGSEAVSRMKVNIWHSVLYTIRRDDAHYPSSDYLRTRRLDERTWVIESLPTEVGQLYSGDSTRELVDEGVYFQSFQIFVTLKD